MKQSSDKIYTNEGNSAVLRYIERSGATILDVGCGGGSLAQRLKAAGHIVDGVTISEEEKQAADEYCRKVIIHDLEKGLPEAFIRERYDYVVCSHVLEHIVYPDALLEDILSALELDGKLIVALPNLMHYKSRFKLLSGNFNYEHAGIWDYTHVKWYTFKSAQQLLTRNGFTIVSAKVTGELPLNSVWRRVLPARLRRSLFNTLSSISKGLFGYQMLFVASRVKQ